jgi:hypothetical protein
MNGVAPTAVFSLPNAPQGGSISGSGDFDGDGDEDLAWFVERSGKRSVHVWFVNGMSAPQMGVALRFGKKTRVRGVADADSDGRVEVITVRKGGFTATAVSPSADGIGADGATEWVTEATSLDGVPASRRWQFLVLQ